MTYRRYIITILIAVGMMHMQAQSQYVSYLPEVPDTITEAPARADYMAIHYWDKVQLNDLSQSDVLEQMVVDYLDLLPHTSSEQSLAQAADTFTAKAHNSGDAGTEAWGYVEKYLYETDSPMLNEGLFEVLVDSRLRQPDVDLATRQRLGYKKEQIARCRPGSEAPDMAVLTADGATTMLSDVIKDAPAILLLYDIECEHCQQTISDMMADTRLGKVLTDGRLRVVALNIADEVARDVPQIDGWTWAQASDDEAVDDVWAMRETPSLYLIGPDGSILLKDVSYDMLSAAIFH